MLTREDVRAVLFDMPKGLEPTEAAGVRATVLFDLTGEVGGRFYVTLDDGTATVSEDSGPEPAAVLRLSTEDYLEMARGRLSGQELFLGGRMRVEGSIGLAMRLEAIFRPMPDDATGGRAHPPAGAARS